MNNQSVLLGIRVIDLTQGPSAPRATALLADYGADVIRIRSRDGASELGFERIARSVFDRSKTVLELDLQSDVDVARLLSLVKSADVLVTSQQPMQLEGLGLDYAHIREVHPQLIFCELTSFGPPGSSDYVHLPAYEALIHAFVGTMAEQTGYREPPVYEGLPFAEIGWAYLAQIAILAALYRRRVDGHGRLVETSMLDGALTFMSMLWGHADSDDAQELMAAGAQRLFSRTVLTADDEYLGVHTGASGAFGRFVDVMGLSDRIAPSSTGVDIGVALTSEQQRILDEEVFDIFRQKSRKEWLEALLDADICAIPVLRPTEVFDEPQVRHNEMVTRVHTEDLGPVDQVAAPIRFAPAQVMDRQAPVPRSDPTVAKPLLSGVKVLDLGVWYAAGYSSRLLADLGADVVKIEPLGGDQMRGMRRPFQSAHSRKRSFVADLKHPLMGDVVNELMRWADVVHHNMRPGVAERLGMGFEQARSVNPSIVYLHAPGWGTTGPEVSRQSFAPLMSGYVGASYEAAGQFNPPVYPVGNEDPGGGMLGAMGILMALANLEGSRYIELPQLNAAMNQTAHIVRDPSGNVLGADRLDPLQLRLGPLDGLYSTSDGWICVVAKTADEIAALGELTGVDVSTLAATGTSEELSQRLSQSFSSRSTEHWLAELHAADVPAMAPVVTNNNRAFLMSTQNQMSRRVSEVAFGEYDRLRQLDSFIRVDGSAEVPFAHAPILGQHTAKLLGELGYSQSAIQKLEAAGAIYIAGHESESAAHAN